MQIREVKTASNNIAVQIVYYKNRKRVIFKHVGSGGTDEQIDELRIAAKEIIKSHTNQLSIIAEDNPNKVFNSDHCACLGVYYNWLYNALTSLQKQIGIQIQDTTMLNDLVAIRIIEPASKLRSIELIEQYFGIKHRRQRYYESALQWLELKTIIEKSVIAFTKQAYGFNFEIVFYDVTTLYFETFVEDDLRKNGFSKDNKSQQPQIVIALMVTQEGLPVAYEIFSGDTFEGKTFIPTIKKFIKDNQVENLIVVADAAMISDENVKDLIANNLNYIVGGRLGNLSAALFNKLDAQLIRKDGNTIRLETDKGFLICSYSEKRYKKDKFEMNKLIEKAKKTITTPSKAKKTKFVKTESEKIVINESLIEKATKLLGLKGYYTNLPESIQSNQLIIERYHELYKIEQAFRIAKSDLKTRPIFHFKEEPIKLHILMCFMALVVSKHIELKTKVSIRKFITDAKKVTDAKMINYTTNKEFFIAGKRTANIRQYEALLNLPH